MEKFVRNYYKKPVGGWELKGTNGLYRLYEGTHYTGHMRWVSICTKIEIDLRTKRYLPATLSDLSLSLYVFLCQSLNNGTNERFSVPYSNWKTHCIKSTFILVLNAQVHFGFINHILFLIFEICIVSQHSRYNIPEGLSQ